MKIAALIACLGLISASLASAQIVPEGAKVRVSSPRLGEKPVLATVISASADSITLRPFDRPITTSMSRAELSSLQMSTGTHRPFLRYAATGLAVGAVGGAIAGYLDYQESDSSDGWCILVCSRQGAAGFGAVVLGTTGLVVGGLYGAFTTRDRWTTVIAPQKLSISPTSTGVRVGYTSTF